MITPILRRTCQLLELKDLSFFTSIERDQDLFYMFQDETYHSVTDVRIIVRSQLDLEHYCLAADNLKIGGRILWETLRILRFAVEKRMAVSNGSGYKHFINVVVCAFVFGIFAIALGFAVDFFFQEPKESESTPRLVVLILLQLIITTLVIYYFDILFEAVLGYDSDVYFGLTIFCVIFFLVQTQMLHRLSILYKRITGRDI